MTTAPHLSPAPDPADEPVDPFAVVAAGVSLALLVAGVVWPHMAGSMLRALVLLLGLLYVGRRLGAAQLPTTRLLDEWTPFDGGAEPLRSHAPAELRDLERELRFANEPDAARRAVVHGPVRRILGEALARRLADRHGIEIEGANALPDLPDGLSEPTRAFLEALVEAPGALVHDRPTTIDDMYRILDDLEAL